MAKASKSQPSAKVETEKDAVETSASEAKPSSVIESEPEKQTKPKSKKELMKEQMKKEVDQANQRSEDSEKSRAERLDSFMKTVHDSKGTIEALVRDGIDADFSREGFMQAIGPVFGKAWIEYENKLRKA